jgi:hypothetical protein
MAVITARSASANRPSRLLESGFQAVPVRCPVPAKCMCGLMPEVRVCDIIPIDVDPLAARFQQSVLEIAEYVHARVEYL